MIKQCESCGIEIKCDSKVKRFCFSCKYNKMKTEAYKRYLKHKNEKRKIRTKNK